MQDSVLTEILTPSNTANKYLPTTNNKNASRKTNNLSLQLINLFDEFSLTTYRLADRLQTDRFLEFTYFYVYLNMLSLFSCQIEPYLVS